MDSVTIVFLLLLGLLLLVAGGELLVRGASRIATLFGISPLVVGLTVVSFGTSSPELAVSIQAGLAGNSDVAVGNVVGSNILNVLFTLGVCALVLPLIVSRQLVQREVPIMIGVSVVFLVVALDGRVSFLDGLLLFAGIVVYTGWSVAESRRETAAVDAGTEAGIPDTAATQGPVWLVGAMATVLASAAAFGLGWTSGVAAALLVCGGLAFVAGYFFGDGGGTRIGDIARHGAIIVWGFGALVAGADNLIESATAIARAFGLSDLVIGLTIVAFGTSLPEIVTSIIASLRDERDIAIGNVVGSNIFNILGIAGLAAMVTPGGLSVNDLVLSFDLPIMIAVALACLPIFFTGFSIARWEGFLFLASYAAYAAFLILVATGDPALETFTNAMLLMLPVVVATLAWTTVQALRGQRNG